MSTNRRHFARVSFEAPARLTTRTERLDVVVLDLSFKGALVRLSPGSPTPALGTRCWISMGLLGLDEQITLDCEVAHFSGQDLGLLCRGLDIDSMTHLRRLIELQLGDPQLLERELHALVAP